MSTANMAGKIPATVITGFLGAGKTTLIRRLLARSGGRRLALIINEFGDLGVDRDLLLGCGDESCGDGDIVELANGCLCCTVADEFLPAMSALLDRPDPPEHIIIETSGLALPKPLVKAFDWPDVRTRATVDGVIAVVDSAALAAGRFAADPDAVAGQLQADAALDHETPLGELLEEQLGCADLVILHKADLIDAETLADVARQLRPELRPGTRMLPAANGDLRPEVLLGLGAMAEDDLDSRPSHHDGADDHDHDDFDSFVVDLPPTTDPAVLTRQLRYLAESHDILRLKGFAHVPGKAMRLAIQGVGPRIDTYYDRPWPADTPKVGRLVVIAQKGIDQDAISGHLSAA